MKDNENIINVCAIIVAAGKGTRMNIDINKQYLEVAGKPILARTLEVFQNCSLINSIIVVVNKDDLMYCNENIIEKYKIKKVKILVVGGNERQQSVFNALKEVEESVDVVVIHDGARPLVLVESIEESIKQAYKYDAACVAVPVKDTIKVADNDLYIAMTPERSALWAVQTPQTFKREVILKAHSLANDNGFSATDDSALVERIGLKPKLIMGSYKNIKITTQEDINIAEAMIREKG